jgi:hypothetical protein
MGMSDVGAIILCFISRRNFHEEGDGVEMAGSDYVDA